MSERAAFMRAILAAPDDDLPRLVYADWLDERGDPLGEFIRIQLAIAALADEPHSDAGVYGTGRPSARDRRDAGRLADLRAREMPLLHAHVPAWVAPLGSAVTGLRFWRGFVDTARCSVATFLADGGRWAESTAIRRVRLFGLTAFRADVLAASPLLAPLRAIELEFGEATEDLLLALARSPLASGLRDLYVSGTVGDVTARAILRSPYMTGLTTLTGWPLHLTPEVSYAMRRRFGGRW